MATEQTLKEDIKFFQAQKNYSPIYSIMAMRSYYDHGSSLSEEESVEWTEFVQEVKNSIAKLCDKNIVDRNMRIKQLNEK